MKTKLTRERVQVAIRRIQEEYGELPDGRPGFVLSAIYCQINEGVSPSIAGALPCRNFDFARMSVEFAPFHEGPVVCRALSEETANYLQAQFKKFGRQPDDLIHTFPLRLPTRWKNHVRIHPARYLEGHYVHGIYAELKSLGFSIEEFRVKELGWLWLDQHPKLKNQEIRSAVLARFVLKWSPPHHQEALMSKIYKDIPVMRPSWAYPAWHKDAQPAAPDKTVVAGPAATSASPKNVAVVPETPLPPAA